MAPLIGILAVQGAFVEHSRKLQQLGCNTVEVRKCKDLNHSFDGLIFPGGESTAQSKLLHDSEMFTPIKTLLEEGMPVFGTCAGLILLARNSEEDFPYERFATLPVQVKRNAYGRQLGSFQAKGRPGNDLCSATAREADVSVPMTFIRAPKITKVDEGVDVLVWNGEEPVAVQWNRQIGCAFHPELTDDLRLYKHFLTKIR